MLRHATPQPPGVRWACAANKGCGSGSSKASTAAASPSVNGRMITAGHSMAGSPGMCEWPLACGCAGQRPNRTGGADGLGERSPDSLGDQADARAGFFAAVFLAAGLRAGLAGAGAFSGAFRLARYWSNTAVEIRPRGDISMPFSCAQARTATGSTSDPPDDFVPATREEPPRRPLMRRAAEA